MSRKNTNQNTPHPIKDKLSQENVFFETNWLEQTSNDFLKYTS
jgi:hypothetical protein